MRLLISLLALLTFFTSYSQDINLTQGDLIRWSNAGYKTNITQNSNEVLQFQDADALDLDGFEFYLGLKNALSIKPTSSSGADGLVGINKANPSFTIDAYGNRIRLYNESTLNQIYMSAEGAYSELRSGTEHLKIGPTSGSYDTYIGSSSFCDLIVDGGNGNIGVGLSCGASPVHQLQVQGDIGLTGEIVGVSDYKLKKNIQQINNPIKLISDLNPVQYEFRTDEFLDINLPLGKRNGLIAQEVEDVFPNLVKSSGQVTHINGTEMDIQSVNYIELIPVLIAAIKEQQNQIDQQQVLIQELISDK